jgi:hypothetical protein
VNTGLFPPSKRNGLLFHGALLVVLGVVCTWAVLNVSAAGAGTLFVLYLLLAIGAFAPIPFLSYRAYALFRSQYRLDRNSLELRWGLRDEHIPLSDIEWVRSESDLARAVAIPPVPMPGAVLGLRRDRDLGVIEFLASSTRHLLFVATAKRVYAISPAEPVRFVETFARAVELGSLKVSQPKSLYPSFVFARAWRSGLARYLWLAALFLNIGLVAWMGLLIPSSPRFALGFGPDRSPTTVPSIQLVILPLLSTFLSLAGWFAGLYFYRWRRWQTLAMIIWGSGALSSFLFMIAVLYIVTTPT